jgi:hypothetical protein
VIANINASNTERNTSELDLTRTPTRKKYDDTDAAVSIALVELLDISRQIRAGKQTSTAMLEPMALWCQHTAHQ